LEEKGGCEQKRQTKQPCTPGKKEKKKTSILKKKVFWGSFTEKKKDVNLGGLKKTPFDRKNE